MRGLQILTVIMLASMNLALPSAAADEGECEAAIDQLADALADVADITGVPEALQAVADYCASLGELEDQAEALVNEAERLLACRQNPATAVQCATGLIPGDGSVEVTASMTHVCTGSSETLKSGTVGGTAGGNVRGFTFSIEATKDVYKKTHYTIACEAHAFATVTGWDGFFRNVYMTSPLRSQGVSQERSPGCDYTGLPGSTGCSVILYEFGDDSWGAEGIVPRGGKVPTEIEVCPPGNGNWVTGHNQAYQQLIFQTATDTDGWECETTGITWNELDIAGLVDQTLSIIGLEDDLDGLGLPEDIWDPE